MSETKTSVILNNNYIRDLNFSHPNTVQYIPEVADSNLYIWKNYLIYKFENDKFGKITKYINWKQLPPNISGNLSEFGLAP